MGSVGVAVLRLPIKGSEQAAQQLLSSAPCFPHCTLLTPPRLLGAGPRVSMSPELGCTDRAAWRRIEAESGRARASRSLRPCRWLPAVSAEAQALGVVAQPVMSCKVTSRSPQCACALHTVKPKQCLLSSVSEHVSCEAASRHPAPFSWDSHTQ